MPILALLNSVFCALMGALIAHLLGIENEAIKDIFFDVGMWVGALVILIPYLMHKMGTNNIFATIPIIASLIIFFVREPIGRFVYGADFPAHEKSFALVVLIILIIANGALVLWASMKAREKS